MVLWTRLTGDNLRRARGGALGSRRRREVPSASSRAARKPPRRPGATASTPSRSASSRAAGTGTASPRSASAARSAAPAPRRRPMRRRRCASWSRAASATTSATTPPGAMPPPRTPTSCSSSATTSTSRRAARTRSAATKARWRRRLANIAPATPPTRATRCCRRRTARAPWLMVWDDHEVANDYANLQGQDLEADFATRRAAAYQAYWEHMPFPKSARPRGADMRIASPPRLGHAGTHPPGRRSPVPRSAGLPEARSRRLEHDPARRVPGAGRSEAQPPRPGAGALALRRLGRGAALEPARPADADDPLRLGRPGRRQRGLLERRLGRLRGLAQPPARRRRREEAAGRGGARRRRAQQLRRRPQGRLRRSALAGRRQRVLRHLDHRASRSPSRGSTRRAASIRTSASAAPTSAAT